MLHEDAKTIIGRLIEVWAMEHDVDLRGFGGTTFRREAKERGLEPDECYKLGKLEEDGVPDIAVEVIVSSALVDKMAVYAGLGVPEVWEWRPGSGTIAVHRSCRRELRAQGAAAKLFLIWTLRCSRGSFSPGRIRRGWPRRTRRRCDRIDAAAPVISLSQLRVTACHSSASWFGAEPDVVTGRVGRPMTAFRNETGVDEQSEVALHRPARDIGKKFLGLRQRELRPFEESRKEARLPGIEFIAPRDDIGADRLLASSSHFVELRREPSHEKFEPSREVHVCFPDRLQR